MLEGAIAKGFVYIGQKLFEAAVVRAGKKLSSLLENFTTDFEPHLKSNFDRCAKVRTILNKMESVDLLSMYINLKFSIGKTIVDDYLLIENVEKYKNIVITGTGGGGKTIFMKYLWISLFVNSNGRIPVFLELRKMNEMETINLLSYVFRSMIDIKSKITQDYFEYAARSGMFIFILDGFDEVSYDKRDEVERQILNLARNYPELVVIVSGRPDERFGSWQSFYNFRVEPLDINQVCSLIEKIDYEKKIKAKFIKRIRKDLYQKHRSFLSNPLLSTMMLLTFDQFADIPDKAFLFYDQAFDTLFLRHDATKEGFQRKKYTKLTIDEFKKSLSYFCLFSYFDEKFQFSETDLLIYGEKALDICLSKETKGDFCNDLVESVCVLQRIGLEVQFTHRSFQEYFCAYCLANYIEGQFYDIICRIIVRRSDNVVPLLSEMKKERFESEFLVPRLKLLHKKLQSDKKSGMSPVEAYIKSMGGSIGVVRFANEKSLLIMPPYSLDNDIMNIIFRSYSDAFPKMLNEPLDLFGTGDSEFVESLLQRKGVKDTTDVLERNLPEVYGVKIENEDIVGSKFEKSIINQEKMVGLLLRKLQREGRQRREKLENILS